MASGEMLKKLLDEFTEKEALVREEIQVVYDEIAQLEAKMEVCKLRLGTIGGDRDKVVAMRRRILEKKFDSPKVAPKAQPAVPQPTAATPPAVYPPAEAAIQPASGGALQELRKRLGIGSILGQRKPQAGAVPPPPWSQDGVGEQPQQPSQPTYVAQPHANNPAFSQSGSIEQPSAPVPEQASAAPANQEEDKDDAVKSINDALRSLFR